MLLKYDIVIDNKIIAIRLHELINQTYKLLPTREENTDWLKPLETILEQLTGISNLIIQKNKDYSEILFLLLSKMEGLYSLTQEDKFQCYRRTIFECLRLMSILREKICLQN